MRLSTTHENMLLEACEKHGFTEDEINFWLEKLAEFPVSLREDLISFLWNFPKERQWLKSFAERQRNIIITGNRLAWGDLMDEMQNHLTEMVKDK